VAVGGGHARGRLQDGRVDLGAQVPTARARVSPWHAPWSLQTPERHISSMLGHAAVGRTVAWLLPHAQALAGRARGSADAAAGAVLRPRQALRSTLRPDGPGRRPRGQSWGSRASGRPISFASSGVTTSSSVFTYTYANLVPASIGALRAAPHDLRDDRDRIGALVDDAEDALNDGRLHAQALRERVRAARRQHALRHRRHVAHDLRQLLACAPRARVSARRPPGPAGLLGVRAAAACNSQGNQASNGKGMVVSSKCEVHKTKDVWERLGGLGYS